MSCPCSKSLSAYQTYIEQHLMPWTGWESLHDLALYLPTWDFILYQSPPASYPLSTTEAFYFSSLFLPYELYTGFLALLNAAFPGSSLFLTF